MALHTIKRSITLKEMPDGRWLWAERGRYYLGLMRAYRALNREDRQIAKNNGTPVISIITYEPVSVAGRIVAEALAAGKLQ